MIFKEIKNFLLWLYSYHIPLNPEVSNSFAKILRPYDSSSIPVVHVNRLLRFWYIYLGFKNIKYTVPAAKIDIMHFQELSRDVRIATNMEIPKKNINKHINSMSTVKVYFSWIGISPSLSVEWQTNNFSWFFYLVCLPRNSKLRRLCYAMHIEISYVFYLHMPMQYTINYIEGVCFFLLMLTSIFWRSKQGFASIVRNKKKYWILCNTCFHNNCFPVITES